MDEKKKAKMKNREKNKNYRTKTTTKNIRTVRKTWLTDRTKWPSEHNNTSKKNKR